MTNIVTPLSKILRTGLNPLPPSPPSTKFHHFHIPGLVFTVYYFIGEYCGCGHGLGGFDGYTCENIMHDKFQIQDLVGKIEDHLVSRTCK